MESLTRSFSTTSLDINKAWRRKVYDGSPDLRKDIKTARFGETNHHHGRFSKIKKLFNTKNRSASEQQQDSEAPSKKSKSKSQQSSKISGSRDEFESRLMFEIYKNMSASHELSSMYN